MVSKEEIEKDLKFPIYTKSGSEVFGTNKGIYCKKELENDFDMIVTLIEIVVEKDGNFDGFSIKIAKDKVNIENKVNFNLGVNKFRGEFEITEKEFEEVLKKSKEKINNI